jgi:hypothetical protein
MAASAVRSAPAVPRASPAPSSSKPRARHARLGGGVHAAEGIGQARHADRRERHDGGAADQQQGGEDLDERAHSAGSAPGFVLARSSRQAKATAVREADEGDAERDVQEGRHGPRPER